MTYDGAKQSPHTRMLMEYVRRKAPQQFPLPGTENSPRCCTPRKIPTHLIFHLITQNYKGGQLCVLRGVLNQSFLKLLDVVLDRFDMILDFLRLAICTRILTVPDGVLHLAMEASGLVFHLR